MGHLDPIASSPWFIHAPSGVANEEEGRGTGGLPGPSNPNGFLVHGLDYQLFVTY